MKQYLTGLVLVITILVCACVDRPAQYAKKREDCLSMSKTCQEYVACVKSFPGDAPAVGDCK